MKTITVPSDWGNPVVVEINTGEKVVLTAGTTVSVPEEVASVIENAIANLPKSKPAESEVLTIHKLDLQDDPIDIFSLADGMYIGPDQSQIKVTDDFSIVSIFPYNFVVTTEKSEIYTDKQVVFYGVVADSNYENLYTIAILQLYKTEPDEWTYEFSGIPYNQGG